MYQYIRSAFTKGALSLVKLYYSCNLIGCNGKYVSLLFPTAGLARPVTVVVHILFFVKLKSFTV